MRERLISIDRSYEREYGYIVKSLEKEKIISAESEYGSRLNVHVATVSDKEERLLCSVLEEVLFTGFKWRYYAENVSAEANFAEDKALRFCLLDFDSGAERRFFREKIFTSLNIHIDAVYNFGMGVVKNVWRSYVELINDFYSTIPDRSDKLELIAYTLSLNIRKSEAKRMKYYVEDGKEQKILQNVFYYREKPQRVSYQNEEVERLVREIFGKYQ